jgi:hypothetical protein
MKQTEEKLISIDLERKQLADRLAESEKNL